MGIVICGLNGTGKSTLGKALVEKLCFYFKSEVNRIKIGEVCLLTNSIIRLADFYKTIFEIDNGSNDNVHQFIILEETMC